MLKQVDKNWLYVESGNVRGFVKKSDVYTGKNAQKVLKIYQKRTQKAAKEAGEKYTIASGGISEVNATEDMYGRCLGNFQITYYCISCKIEFF